nr:hypothetical protein CFP56_02659 [Quercus suber]
MFGLICTALSLRNGMFSRPLLMVCVRADPLRSVSGPIDFWSWSPPQDCRICIPTSIPAIRDAPCPVTVLQFLSSNFFLRILKDPRRLPAYLSAIVGLQSACCKKSSGVDRAVDLVVDSVDCDFSLEVLLTIES